MYRRNKYFDLIICCGCGLFLLFWYYSRRDVSNKLMSREEEKKEAIAYMNSLKEELKIVFQHTQSLEVLLKNERFSHQLRQKELHFKSRYDQVNISINTNKFENDLKEKTLLLQSYNRSNMEMKTKHLELLHRTVRVRDDFRTLSHKSMSDIQSLRQAAEMAALSLNDRIEDLESQKKYYQKQSVQYDFDNKKSINKLNHCYKVLALKNPLKRSKRKDKKSNKKKAKRKKSKQKLSKTHLENKENKKSMKSIVKKDKVAQLEHVFNKSYTTLISENPEMYHHYPEKTVDNVVVSRTATSNKPSLDHIKHHSDNIVQHSHNVVQHSDNVVQHSDNVVQHSDNVVQHSDNVVQHLELATKEKISNNAIESIIEEDDNEIREPSLLKSNNVEDTNG